MLFKKYYGRKIAMILFEIFRILCSIKLNFFSIYDIFRKMIIVGVLGEYIYIIDKIIKKELRILERMYR